MTYSKRDRETAAVRCSLIADYWARGTTSTYAYDFQPRVPAVELSEQAYEHACSRRPRSLLCGQGIAEIWAEAEALIRTGWEPTP